MAKGKPGAAAWRNRIVETGEAFAAELLANPLNWRTHPKAQREAMKAAFDELGWIQQVVVNKRTGRLIDGHMRVELAKERGEIIPVVYVDLSDEEEKLALATYDPLGDMASSDKVALSKLIKDSKVSFDTLDELMGSIAQTTKIKADEIIDTSDIPDIIPQGESDAFDLNAMAIFSSSNIYGLPDLLPDMLCEQVPHNVWAGNEFGEPEDIADYLFMKDRVPARWEPRGGILGFYVFDKYFDYIWTDAVKNVRELLGRGWAGMVAPDFSFAHDEPFAVKLWHVYRSRWIARFWQECGIPVIPNTVMLFPGDRKWLLETLPKDCPVLSMQVRTTDDELGKKGFIYAINEHVDHCNPKAFLLYGGAENRNWIEPNVPKGVEYVYLSSVAKQRSDNRKGKKGRNK